MRDLPLDRLLVETDAPYLAPVPYRGKRNEPAFVAATAAAVAALKGLELEQLAASDERQFLPPVRQGERRPLDEGDRPRLRRLDRRAGDRAGIGAAAIPADPRNRRRRVSVLVEIGAVVILIDTSPDLREQLLDAGVARLDAVVMTHAHADHLHGIDDLRSVNRLMRQRHPALCRAPDAGRNRRAASAMSSNRSRSRAGTTSRHWCRTRSRARSRSAASRSCRSCRITASARHWVCGSEDLPIRPTSTELDDNAFAALDGVELWIVDCLRREPHPTHSHLAKTLSWIARVRSAPRRADPHGSEPRLPRAERRIAEGRRARS